MGYALLLVTCLRCRLPFGCNPHRVPSIRVTPGGPREPLCRACFDVLQAVRVEKGLEPWPEPLPGAYEAIAEEEL